VGEVNDGGITLWNATAVRFNPATIRPGRSAEMPAWVLTEPAPEKLEKGTFTSFAAADFKANRKRGRADAIGFGTSEPDKQTTLPVIVAIITAQRFPFICHPVPYSIRVYPKFGVRGREKTALPWS